LSLAFLGNYTQAWAQSLKNWQFWTLVGLLVLPFASIAGYYLHLFEPPIWYIEWRSFPYTEISVGLVGWVIGYFCKKLIQEPFPSLFLSGLLSAGLVLLPFLKPILRPIRLPLTDKWQANICLQSCPSTCGAASLATLFKLQNIQTTEPEIARNAYSCGSGTEIWYLLRFARAQGLNLKPLIINNLEDLQKPALLGTSIGANYGHFVVFLGKNNDRYQIGDPLKGLLLLNPTEFKNAYTLHPIAYECP
jgi:hypothetical protein